MRKIEDKETRYFIDLDLKTRKILRWNPNPNPGTGADNKTIS